MTSSLGMDFHQATLEEDVTLLSGQISSRFTGPPSGLPLGQSRREHAAQEKAATSACRKNLLRITPLVPVEVPSPMLSGTDGILPSMHSPLPRRYPWDVELRGVRCKVENDLEPPVWFVGDLNGSAVQVSLRTNQDIK